MKRAALSRALPLLLALSLLAPSALAAPPVETDQAAQPAQEPQVVAMSTSASGAIVIDGGTGEVYYEKNADTPRPAASMTKLMSLYLVFDAIDAGELSLTTPIPISAELAQISRTKLYSGLEKFTAGASYPAEDLIKLAITASGNASIMALAEYLGGGSEAVFVERMNTTTRQWGIDAKFADSSGFLDKGNAVSPRAMAEIARRLLTDHPEILNYSQLLSVNFQGRTYSTTNTILKNATLPGIDGLKTGFTYGAGYCFTGTAQRDGARIISVVMNTASASARMSESRKLLEYGFTCRKEREAAWTQAGQALTASFRTESGQGVAPYTENVFTADIGGLTGEIYCDVQYEVNGVSYPAAKVLQNGAVPGVKVPDLPWQDTTVALNITFPNGAVVRRESVIPVSAPLTFTGYLGVGSATLCPGSRITVPCKIQCDQGITCRIPCGWYLDGEPIPYFSNPSFTMTPQGLSSYTFFVNPDTPVGVHALEFRCNPDGLPGAVPAVLSTQLTVVAPPF